MICFCEWCCLISGRCSYSRLKVCVDQIGGYSGAHMYSTLLDFDKKNSRIVTVGFFQDTISIFGYGLVKLLFCR